MGLDGFLSRQTRREIIKKGNRMPNGKWYLYAFAFMIVVLLSIVLILIFIDFMESPQESVFHRYIDRLNDGDAKGATDLTIYSFMSYDEYMNEVHYLEDFIEQYGEQKIWIDENEMIGKDHLWAMYKNEIEYHIEWFESEYGVEVEDYCALNVAISNFDNHFEDRYDEMECYKIDSNWYLVYP